MFNVYIWFRHEESGKPQICMRYGPEACALPNYTTRCFVMLWVACIPTYDANRGPGEPEALKAQAPNAKRQTPN